MLILQFFLNSSTHLKLYETRDCKLTLKDNPLIDWNLIFTRKRKRRAGLFDWENFYAETLLFNNDWGNDNKLEENGILHGNDFWGRQPIQHEAKVFAPRQLEPIQIGITASLEGINN